MATLSEIQGLSYSSSCNLTPPISPVLMGQHLIFCLLIWATYWKSPRKCTPVKYKARQKAGFPIVTETPSKLIWKWKVRPHFYPCHCRLSISNPPILFYLPYFSIPPLIWFTLLLETHEYSEYITKISRNEMLWLLQLFLRCTSNAKVFSIHVTFTIEKIAIRLQ